MSIKWNDKVTHVDTQLVLRVVSASRRYQHEMIRVRKVTNDAGFVLVMKNSSRARKVAVCNCRDKTVVISFLQTPVLTAATLDQRTKVQRQITLPNGHAVNDVVPEMRNYLYSGDLLPRTDKVTAVDARSKLTGENVYATLIRSVKPSGRTSEAGELEFDYKLDTGELVFSRFCPIENLEKRVEDGEQFFYLENISGSYRVATAGNFNWSFQFEV